MDVMMVKIAEKFPIMMESGLMIVAAEIIYRSTFSSTFTSFRQQQEKRQLSVQYFPAFMFPDPMFDISCRRRWARSSIWPGMADQRCLHKNPPPVRLLATLGEKTARHAAEIVIRAS